MKKDLNAGVFLTQVWKVKSYEMDFFKSLNNVKLLHEELSQNFDPSNLKKTNKRKSISLNDFVSDRHSDDVLVVRVGSYKTYHTHPDKTTELCLKQLDSDGKVVSKETKGKWAKMKAMKALNSGALPCKNCRLHITEEEFEFMNDPKRMQAKVDKNNELAKRQRAMPEISE